MIYLKRIQANKFILLTILLNIGFAFGYGKLNPQIDINMVDSVEIRRVQWFMTNPESCVSREHFDSIYNAGVEFEKSKGHNSTTYTKIVLTKKEDYTLFIRILNSLNPLKTEYVKVLPKDVRLLVSKPNISLRQLMAGDTNDPIPTNTKYIIYFKGGKTCEMFESKFYVDYENWRYTDNIYLYELCFWFYEKGYSK